MGMVAILAIVAIIGVVVALWSMKRPPPSPPVS